MVPDISPAFSSSDPLPNMGPVAASSGIPRAAAPADVAAPGAPTGAGAKGLEPMGADTPGFGLFLSDFLMVAVLLGCVWEKPWENHGKIEVYHLVMTYP